MDLTNFSGGGHVKNKLHLPVTRLSGLFSMPAQLQTTHLITQQKKYTLSRVRRKCLNFGKITINMAVGFSCSPLYSQNVLTAKQTQNIYQRAEFSSWIDHRGFLLVWLVVV